MPLYQGVYNWTLLDALFGAAMRHNKSVILGLQLEVCAPSWLLESGNVTTVQFVHANFGWFRWASLQSWVRLTILVIQGLPRNAMFSDYQHQIAQLSLHVHVDSKYTQ